MILTAFLRECSEMIPSRTRLTGHSGEEAGERAKEQHLRPTLLRQILRAKCAQDDMV